MTDELDPYALIADFYEAEYGRLEADVAFFARRGVAGRLLVLGCGTGRVGRVLGASRGVVGLDRSEAMLAIARERAPQARYVQGDMRDFDVARVGGPFAEIVVPNAAFNFLPRRVDQQRCLAACHRALHPGGLLTLDLPMPDFALLGVRHSPERTSWQGQLGEREARRTRETRRFPAEQRIEFLDRYYLDDALVATSPLTLRLVFPAEVEWMLEAAGFVADALLGDYGGGPVRDGCPRLLVRAMRL